MLGVIGIVLSLMLLIYLAYRDVSVLVLAPVCALLAVVFDGNLPVLATYTQIFMGSVGQFVKDYFPLFLLGALFGKLMEDSGSAAKIADVIVRAVGVQRTVLAIVLSCAILTYGGVSLFVVVFAVFPLSRSLFREADIPRRLIPATIALGSFTFTMTALPGTMQIQNQIPMQFFRTTAFAAPGLGCIGGAVMFVLGMLWLNSRVAQAQKAGEGFGSLAPADEAAVKVSEDQPALPSAMAAFLPILCVIGLNFLFSQLIIPKWDASYLADEQFGKTELSKVVGQWSTILSLVITLLITASLHFRSIEKIKESLSAGAKSSLMPVFNTACEYGYGNTIKSLAGFTVVQNFVTGIAPGNPLISEAIAVNALAGITGSASGGLSIALRTLGETYYERAVAAGIDPQLLHRVASMSCGCLDSLPHNGALITLLLICGVTHRQSYRDVGVVTIVCPLIATAVVVALGTVFGSF
ncbi:MAG: GntP family permease [Planctomycetota bacterium]|jgi:H+/gluconate symporter-like permease|nr:MAG: GntP family permease [Planctomycetota bacterium]